MPTDRAASTAGIASGRRLSSSVSKYILQRELQLAHIRSSGADHAEIERRSQVGGISPIRVIGKVEGLKPELQRVSFRNAEVLLRRKVPGENSRRRNGIAARVAERAKWLYGIG